MSRIDDLLARQSHELAALQEAQARDLLRAVDEARAEILARLAALTVRGERTPFTIQHMRVILAQTEAAADQLKRKMSATIEAGAGTAHRLAMRDLLATIRAHEPDFIDAGGQIEWAAVRRLQSGLLLHKYSLDRYGAEVVARVQQQLSIGLLQGATIPELTRRVASSSGVIAKLGGRAELIARMEVSGAYNAGHQAALEEAAAVLDDAGTDDPLMRQADEFFDQRNHPLSRVIHGQVTAIDKPWLVSVSAVAAAAEALGKGTGGVLWPDSGGYYAVHGYPAHFNERGRSIPYRASWDQGAALAGQDAAQRAMLVAPLRRKLAA